MSIPRLIPAPIDIEFSASSLDSEIFEREYQQLSESDDDPIHRWLKLAKAKGETAETDPILLELMISLHNKIDALEMIIKDEVPKRVPLSTYANIKAVGFEHFSLQAPLLKEGREYYGRVELPVHPKRDIGMFFKAQTKNLAKIIKIHERDEKEWSAYMTARERVLIREAKDKCRSRR